MDSISKRWRPAKGRRTASKEKTLLNLAQARNKIVQNRETPRSSRDASQQATTAEEPIQPERPTSATRRKFNLIGEVLKERDVARELDNENALQRTASMESDIEDSGHYMIIHKSFWKEFVENLLCKSCQANQLTVKTTEEHGFVKKMIVKCRSCGEVMSSLYTCPRLKDPLSKRPPFAVNRKMCDAFISSGAGYASMERFGVALQMNILNPETYRDHLNKLFLENETLRKEILQLSRDAVRKAHVDLEPSLADQEVIDIAVSYDGSWPKRGHTSLVGFGAVVDILTGLVVDFELVSKHCHICAIRADEFGENTATFASWKKKHIEQGECNINYDGSSNAMEKEVAGIIWKRSEQECKMRYTTMLGDGDSKTFDFLVKEEIYGAEVELVKEECTNHVEKRLGTALRNLVQAEKARGVTLGGRGQGTLKADNIVRLQSYYRLAIQKNAPDVNAMQNAINATIHHANSNNKPANHKFCPKGKDSWCFYQKSLALKEKPTAPTSRTLTLTDQVLKKILPIYKRLSDTELLQRCTQLGTQNSNESLHGVVWRKCPKEMFFSLKRYQLGATMGVGEFNMGLQTMVELKASLQSEPVSKAATAIVLRRDNKRKRKSDIQDKTTAKNARKTAAKKKKSKESTQKRKEGTTYAPGAF